MKLISLTQGKFAKVDDDDYDYLMQWKWFAYKGYKTYYSARSVKVSENLSIRSNSMHRQIMNVFDSETKVDHKNHNGLDNQRSNLRFGQQLPSLNKRSFCQNLRRLEGKNSL